jgi:hypothetical protein
MNPRASFGRRRSLLAFGLIAALACAGPAPAAEPSAPSPALPAVPVVPGAGAAPPAEIVKPITPSKAEIADSAFKKLDVTNKGYVDREDVRGLDGFEPAFVAADPGHSGKLTSAQFKKAWTVYTGH